MTVLQHRVLDDTGKPVAGRTASVMEYGGPEDPQHGYRRVKAFTAVSDDGGWLTWNLPSPSSSQAATYVVTGIGVEPILVRIPVTALIVTVTDTYIGTVSTTAQVPSTVDLVTEQELSDRLAGLSGEKAAIPQTDEEKEQFVPSRLSPETLDSITGTPESVPDTGVRRNGFGGFDTDYINLIEDPASPRHAVPKAWVENALANIPAGASYTDEQVRDVIGVTIVAGSGVTKTVNDAGDTITIAATGGGSTVATIPAGSTLTVPKDPVTGFWPSGWNPDGTPSYTGGANNTGVRPTARSDVYCQWKGPDPSPLPVDSGTGGMLNGKDTRFVT